jgi:hypothetical protein
MSPPISSTVKERVIQLHLEGKGRNEIAEILNLSHIRISQGSVTNILRTYKANTGDASTTTDFPKAFEPSPSQLQTSPTSGMKEEGQIPVSVSQCPDSGQEPLSIEDAKGPEEPATSTPPAVVTTSSTSIPSSSCRFSSTPFPSSSPVPEVSPYLAGVNSYPYLYPHFNPGYLSPQISEVNMGLANPVCLQDSEETTHEEAQEVQVQVQSSVQDQDQDQEESLMDIGWSMVFEEVMEAKKQRRDEERTLEQKKRELEQQRIQVDRARYDLEIREIKLLEAEPLIPIARQLQQMGTDINQFLPWIETIHEKAEADKIDLKTASLRVSEELKLYSQLTGLQKKIQQTQQQISTLDVMYLQKRQAIETLMNLRNAGITEREIAESARFVGVWGKQWQGNGSGGNTDMNGNRSSSGGKANEFKFKLDDKLNV